MILPVHSAAVLMESGAMRKAAAAYQPEVLNCIYCLLLVVPRCSTHMVMNNGDGYVFRCQAATIVEGVD